LAAVAQQVDELVCYDFTEPSQIIARCYDAKLIITNKVVLNASVFAALPNLALVCVAATGTNNVDLASAHQHGVIVCNVRNYAEQAVAQYVFAQLLAYYQRINAHNQAIQQGAWPVSRSFAVHGEPIHELANQCLAIIGYGCLGRKVADLGRAFGMQVLISERADAPAVRPGRVPLHQALTQADIISLHCPLTPATNQLINQHSLALVKPSAILINTARGALIDNHALLNALYQRKLGAAILDVLEQEPPANDHPLLQAKFPNLIITGHIAWASIEAQQRLVIGLAQNIAAFKLGCAINIVCCDQ
jgi:glycerate dehydrogenase